MAISGCDSLMLGRGMVADPGLAHAVRAALSPQTQQMPEAVCWSDLQPHLTDFWELVCSRLDRRKQAGRLKQWLNYLRRRYPQAQAAYEAVRTLNDPVQISQWLRRQPVLVAVTAPDCV
jgi:tRNA-dihydrouridine synthase C